MLALFNINRRFQVQITYFLQRSLSLLTVLFILLSDFFKRLLFRLLINIDYWTAWWWHLVANKILCFFQVLSTTKSSCNKSPAHHTSVPCWSALCSMHALIIHIFFTIHAHMYSKRSMNMIHDGWWWHLASRRFQVLLSVKSRKSPVRQEKWLFHLNDCPPERLSIVHCPQEMHQRKGMYDTITHDGGVGQARYE